MMELVLLWNTFKNLLVLQSVLSIKVEKLQYIVKAGLGRTGCLIGAHLIYTHGFTANECIAYMRMIRPGMVVGPQQHWLYLHHDDFRSWRHTMIVDNRPDPLIGNLFPLCSYEDYKQRLKEAKEKKDCNCNNN